MNTYLRQVGLLPIFKHISRTGGIRTIACWNLFQNRVTKTDANHKFCRIKWHLKRGDRGLQLSANVMSDSNSNGNSQQLPEDLTVHHDHARKEFYIMLGEDKAYLQYEDTGRGQVDLFHTLVPPVFRGRGVAKLLAQAALDYFASKSTPMVLSCSYMQKYVQDNQNPKHLKYVVDT